MLSSRRNLDLSGTLSSIRGNLSQLRSRELSAAELTAAFLEDIERQRDLNIFITVDHDRALSLARKSDDRLQAGTARPLEGIPIAVKDNFCTEGMRTTAASKILAISKDSTDGFIPQYESTVTKRLLDAGAVILGKTNMDEFAMGSSTESSYFGPTINPVGVRLGLNDLVPGGSSGGSAAAIAARLCLGAVGTDTGGSVRQPASFCGVVGMKPSYGVCSRWGIIAYASSLDQAGVFGKCVEDVAILLNVIAGEDERDTTSVSGLSFNFTQALKAPLSSLRVGFPRELAAVQTDEAKIVWDRARAIVQCLGADAVEVTLPSIKYALPAYYIIALCEASSNLSRYDGVRYGFRATAVGDINNFYEQTRALGFGTEVKRRILLGTYALSAGYYDAYYLKASKVRSQIAHEFTTSFNRVDVLFMPTAPTGAFQIGSHTNDPVRMYLEDVFTVPINLAGLPAISIPVTQDARGMPLGLQVVGDRFADEKVLRVASAVELAAAQLEH